MVLKIVKKADVQVPAPAPKGKLVIVRKPVSHSAIEESTVTTVEAKQPASPFYISDKWYPNAINCTREPVVLDGQYRVSRANGPNSAVSWFLMASYCYYHLNHSLLSDALYDEIARDLKQHWAEITHAHKSFIKPHHLETGSLFDLPRNMYPSTAVGGLTALLKGNWGATW